MPKKKTAPAPTSLKGWTAIAKFLGTSPSSAQTWAKKGMPVRREGRFTIADSATAHTLLLPRNGDGIFESGGNGGLIGKNVGWLGHVRLLAQPRLNLRGYTQNETGVKGQQIAKSLARLKRMLKGKA
jgi:hypothetical protein